MSTLLAGAAALSQAPKAVTPKVEQKSAGPCSPNIANVSGNVTLEFRGGCAGIDPRAVKQINEFLRDFPKTQRRLQELLDLKDQELAEKVKEIEEWTSKYRDLEKRLAALAADDTLSRKAAGLLREGDLEGAGRVLDELIARDESRTDQLARNHHVRGRAFELQFLPAQALPHYERAFRYRPEVFEYALAYGTLLWKQKRFGLAEKPLLAARDMAWADKSQTVASRERLAMTLNNLGNLYRATQRMKEAESAYQEALTTYRQLARDNPVAFLSNFATNLRNLGVLYSTTQRMKEAESAYQEALTTYRQLARDNPAAFLPDVAMTLNNLGALYNHTQRMKEAESAYQEALIIHHQLARDNPGAFLPGVATTLNNLGVLYSDTKRWKQAESAYQEALTIYLQCGRDNPAAFLPDVAMTLNNLGNLYTTTRRMKEAESAYQQALTIRHQLARDNPAAFLPDLATTLTSLGLLHSASRRAKEAESAFQEASELLEPLWQENPASLGDLYARILRGRASVLSASPPTRTAACRLFEQSLGAAVSPVLREAIAEEKGRRCPQ